MKRNNSAKYLTLVILIILSYFTYKFYINSQYKNLKITSNAYGADISINKKYIGKAPLEHYLKPGKYLIGLNQKGYVVTYDSIEVTEAAKSFHFNLLNGFRYIKKGTYSFRGKLKFVDGFYLSETEVTNKMYMEFCNETGNTLPYYNDRPQLNGERQPVLGVNYKDAVKFTKWYSKKIGYTCRLPYEYEWEYAANKGDTTQVYPWGNEEKINNQYLANYHPYDFQRDELLPINIDGFQFTAPIKSYPPGNNHLFDMGGNVFEWVLDSIQNKHDFSDMNLKVTPDSLIRIVKGGSWNFNQKLMTVKSHVFVNGTIRRGNNGIRLLIERTSAPK